MGWGRRRLINGTRLGPKSIGRVARTVSAGALQLVPHRREATSQAVSPLERSRALNRPLSPDLVIYQPQLTWVLSGFYRVSSIGLTTGIFAGGIAYGFTSHELMYFVAAVKALNLPAFIPFATKFTLGFPISFHVYNGIRHLIWDSGRLLELPGVYKGGYAVLGASTLTAALLAFL